MNSNQLNHFGQMHKKYKKLIHKLPLTTHIIPQESLRLENPFQWWNACQNMSFYLWNN